MPSEEPRKRTATKRPRRAFQHILANIEDIRQFTSGLDAAAFKANALVVAAVERCLGRITEAAFRLDAIADTMAPGPPWGQIRDLGNILRHEYDAVDLNTIWEIVSLDLDALEHACARALAQLPPDP